MMLGLAATAGIACAQQQAAPVQIKAYVQFDKGKPAIIAPKQANGKNLFIYVAQDQEMQGNAAKCKLFFIQTPADLVAASKTLKDRDFAAARKQLAAVKAKYAAWQGLPGDPSTQAALLELDAAIRQMDWEGLKGLVASFPHPDWLESSDQVKLEVARVLSGISTDPAAAATLQASAEAVLKNREKVLNSRDYGTLKYAIGLAQASQIPAEEIKETISEGNVQKANLAIDTLCQAAMSSHGSDMEIPVDAMRRAQALLWAMPGVRTYANNAGKMDRKKWNDAPADFRDAVALAYLIKNVYAPDSKDATLDRAASFFVNTKASQN